MVIVAGKKTPAFTLYPAQRRDGALSPTIGCSIRDWLDPFARAKSSLLLKTHGPSKRELVNKAAYYTLYEWASQRRWGHSLTTTLDARRRRFYATLPSLTLAPAPIWRMRHAVQENTSAT